MKGSSSQYQAERLKVFQRRLAPFRRSEFLYLSDLDLAEAGLLAVRIRPASRREGEGCELSVIGVMNIWTAISESGLMSFGMVLAHSWNALRATSDASWYRSASMCR